MDTKPKILVVDDAPSNIRILLEILRDSYAVATAISGSKALFLANSTPQPDLILLDIMMPEMDGYEVCRRLKADPVTREIPVIFITAKSEVDDEIKGLQLGAVDYITKPISVPIVQARVKTHLALRASNRKLDVRNQLLQRAEEDLRLKNEELAEKNGQLLELNKTLEGLVIMDGLTGIPNRRRFDEYFLQEWNRALRNQHHISLIIIDIDFFKLYNDNYGHAGGDECLRKVAQTLAASAMRTIDLMARYGGEEFACVLPKTDVQGLAVVGNLLIKNINSLHIIHEHFKIAQHVTISLGGATMIPSQDVSPFLLIGRADARLYKAKESGRNRLVVE